MTFEQAKELSFLVPWKVDKCFSGLQCGCRRVVPLEPIYYIDEFEHFGKTLISTETEEYEIVPDSAIDQETAEYIVELHNEHCDRMKQSLLEISKGLTSDIIPFTQNKNTRIIHIKEID